MSPSGNCGELGCSGESGERGGSAANAAEADSDGGEPEDPAVMDAIGGTWREDGLVLSGGNRTVWSAKTVWNTAARPREGSQTVLRALEARISCSALVSSGNAAVGWSAGICEDAEVAIAGPGGDDAVGSDDGEASDADGALDAAGAEADFVGGVRPATTIHAK